MLTVVGALIKDDLGRVYVHRRTADRRLLPGVWDVVGGHVEPGEAAEEALAREIEEETGWRLRRIEAVVAEWEWVVGGVARHETDYLVEVAGDLARPRLEAGKHDAHDWAGPGNLDLLMAGRTDGDRRLRDVVARAVRTRLTPRLRLSPLGPWHAGDLWRLHYDEAVAIWYGGRRTVSMTQAWAARAARGWEQDGVHKWMAYSRADGSLVGRGGLSWARVEGRQRLEVGWTVRSELWGHGYATEIGAAALRFAFGDLGAAEVVAFTESGNRRSRAVMERLGLRYARTIMRDGAPFALYEIRRDTADRARLWRDTAIAVAAGVSPPLLRRGTGPG
jgi:RimJ/RimL family protein N-acetyltransferase/ADP-ribose pyrophosphatase YjhB (NUDIX family)